MEKDKGKKHSRKPFFRFIKGIVKIFKRKPKFVYLGERPSGACIYISNHSAASGPTTYELYLPTAMRMWGTYEMCGGFNQRRKYLCETYYRRKKKYSKFGAFMRGTLAAPFTALFYKGMRLIPTYPDIRFTKTLRLSVDELIDGTSILIFPENSDDGYHDIMTEYFGGFHSLAKCYNKKTGKDIDIVNMYYDRKLNTVIVGAPQSFLSLSERFCSRAEVVEYFRTDTNAMYEKYILPERRK